MKNIAKRLRITAQTVVFLCLAIGAIVWSPTSMAQINLAERLIGHWKADFNRTAELRHNELKAEDETLESFEETYGKMHKIYTATHVTMWMEDAPTRKYRTPYKVALTDARSVIIQSTAPNGQKMFDQIFFDKLGYYVLAGRRVEFFRQLK